MNAVQPTQADAGDAGGDGVAPEKSRRTAPDAVAAARLRVAASSARVAFEKVALSPTGRGGARRSRRYRPVTAAELGRKTPAITLLLHPAALKDVVNAATAALMSHTVAMAITKEAVAALPFDAGARRFGLAHRNLTMLDDEMPQTRAYETVYDRVAALWISLLPPAISESWDVVAEPLSLPRPESVIFAEGQAILRQEGAASPRSGGYVVPLAGGRVEQDRALTALTLAISAYCTEDQ